MTAQNSTLLEETPNNCPEFVQALVKKLYGIECRAIELACERDQIFKLENASDNYILRFTNPAEQPLVSDFQTKVFLHIEQNDPKLAVPRIIPTLAGENDMVVTMEDNRPSLLRLISFMPGIPLAKVPRRQSGKRRSLAKILARLGLALRDFQHPASVHELLWDIKQAPKLRQYLPYIQDAKVRQLARQGLDNFEQYVLPVQPRLRSQVIHNDFNFSNVIIDKDADQITGILDFGDMIYAPLVYDVAVAAAYQISGKDEDALDALLEFVTTYHQYSALEQAELRLLYDLVITREVMTLAITEWRAALHPGNRSYILRNHKIAITAIKRLFQLDRKMVSQALIDACLG